MVDRASVWLTVGAARAREFSQRIRIKLVKNEILLRASAVAYYALTALVPFLAVLVAFAAHLAPDITGESAARGAVGDMTVAEFRDTLSRFLPEAAYEVVANEIAHIQKQPPVGLLSLSLAVSLWLASSLFGTIIDALNRIQGVVETRPYWSLALRAIGLTVLEAVVMLATLIVLILPSQFRAWVGWHSRVDAVETATELLIVASGVLISFSIIYYVGPNIRRRWKWVTPGSVFGTLAFLASGLLLRTYVQFFGNYSKTYGSLAGVMLLLFWFWIAALILLVAFQIDRIIEDEQGKTTMIQSKSRYATILPEAGTWVAADVMNPAPRTCSRFSRVIEAVLIFKDEDCGLVPVVEECKPIGVVTDRDVALALATHADLVDHPIEEIMTTSLISVAPSAPAAEVLEAFGREAVRRLLVVDSSGLLVGVIGWKDVCGEISDREVGRAVSEVVESP